MKPATIVMGAAAMVLLGLSYAIAATAGVLVTAVMVTVLVVLAGRAELSGAEPTGAGLPRPRHIGRPNFPTYERFGSAMAWMGSSKHAWDCEMRPKLVPLIDAALAERYGTDLTHRPDLGRRLLGDELWPLVDPSRPRSDDRDTPGPSRRTLERILDRLEAR
jgi:hypothetical protein